jgi:hypothetical protein
MKHKLLELNEFRPRDSFDWALPGWLMESRSGEFGTANVCRRILKKGRVDYSESSELPPNVAARARVGRGQ